MTATSASTPSVSVVVATRNRAHLLPRLVAALAAQTGVDGLEVVVVDDASTDDTPAVLERLAGSASIRLVTRRREIAGGAATARNDGWRSAVGDVVLFTDDDCVPQPGWAARLVAELDEADVVQGRTVPAPGQTQDLGPFSHTIEVTSEAGEYETCNMAYRRPVLEAVGGFGEEFRYPYGEDTDLAWRAKAAGFRTAFAAEAVVHHDVRPSHFGTYLRDRRRREGMVLTMRNHPNLRRRLWGGLFLHPSHAAALSVAVTGVAAARQRTPVRMAMAAASGGWYAWNCRQTRPRPRRRVAWLGVVPAALVADLYETAVVVRAAIRYRTPVV
ncbi:MAG: glycosyltransferase [Actinobacteria bacterium]|nr:glycosyltransferase [Actinomycetota bacterium]MBV9256174.1 glycosyltransferase [Actinomycetota bacterium]MBV9663861.1 glycosyltransferase [Actinomycetota bacterium]